MLLSLGSSCQDVWSGFLQNGCFWRKATILKKSNPFLRSPALTTMIWRIFALCPALPLFQRSVRKLSSLSSSVIYPPIIYSFYFNLPTDWSTTLRQPYWKWPSALPWPWKRICSYSAWSISCLWYNRPYHSSPTSWTCLWHTWYCTSPDVILCGWLGLKHQLTN